MHFWEFLCPQKHLLPGLRPGPALLRMQINLHGSPSIPGVFLYCFGHRKKTKFSTKSPQKYAILTPKSQRKLPTSHPPWRLRRLNWGARLWPPTSTPGSAYVRVGGRLAPGAEEGWTPLILTLKSNLGQIKKSQSISRDVIGLYRVGLSVAASFSLSHVVSRRGLTVTRACVLRLTVNSLELTEHDNHSSFKTRRNNDWSGSSNFSKPAVNNLSGFRILESWRRLSQTHYPPPLVTTPKTVAAEVKAYVGERAMPAPAKKCQVALFSL